MWRVIIALVGCFVVAQAQVTLEESGNCTGQGTHLMGLQIAGLTIEEATFLLGPAHGWNVTQDGLVTFTNGSQVRLIDCNGSAEWVPV